MSGLSKHIPGTKAHDIKKAKEQSYNDGSTGGLRDHSTPGGLSVYDDTPSGMEESVNPSGGSGTAGNTGVRPAPGPKVNPSTGYNYSYPAPGYPSQFSSGSSGATTTSRHADATRTSPTQLAYNGTGGGYTGNPRSSGGIADGVGVGNAGGYSDHRGTGNQDINATHYGNRGGMVDGVRGGGHQDFARHDRYDDRGNYSSTAIHPPPPPEDDRPLAPVNMANMTQSTTTTTPSGYTTTTTTTPHTTRPHPDEREAMAGAMEGGSTTAHAKGVVRGVQAKADRLKDTVNRVADDVGERGANRKYGTSDPVYRADGYS